MTKNRCIQFHCPRCNKLASENNTYSRRNFATEALSTPYFLCGKCRLIFISNELVRRVVSDWWHRNKSAQQMPFEYFYDKSIEYLYGTVLDYYKRISYRLTRFKKI